ncbi:MAG: hypothetical protein V1767_03640 [Chloroflexota bacterium]
MPLVNMLYIVFSVAFAGGSLGLGVGYFGFEFPRITQEFAQLLFKICAAVMIIDLIAITTILSFKKKPDP